ncbi:pentatricopeptide repeat-containing protein At2g20710, mitochondrial-like isoform X1 [Actinidia eriantha]|uniref:pentatricopeptide repeat-containing protein At2g20710, mitochondrial-like isoform X1 n=2 Tax=Actinidia eriantha TaxID=165200 RepID=UPI002584868D|nr:pentatricopeptide repeat-containing protein At2g20710, mitochondrial-like isoform X1 [Actinidia eriantha]
MMMMKLLQSCKSSSWRNKGCISRVLSILLFSTQTVASSSSKDTLYGRLLPFGNPRASIVPVLDQWAGEGRIVEQEELQVIIKSLRKFRRFKHALEISEWMSNKRYLDLSPGDVAVRLDLISKVHGLEQAEKYFSNIPIAYRGLRVIGALLNCYAHAKSLEKAEATMQKLRELGFVLTPLPYNVMLKLYADMGKREKLDPLMQEMEKEGITCDKFTFNIRLNAYSTDSDIEGMEKLLMKMEADPVVNMDWHAYIVAANGYLRAGVVEKALEMLKKSEQLVAGKTSRFAYEVLLTLYASIGKKNEVYRIWDLYKKTGKVYNMSYLSMISALAKLDDLDGAEMIWEEWEAKKEHFDFRIPNLVIKAYCKKGLLGKAESIVNRLVESGKEPSGTIWQHLASGYQEDDQMEKAAETMKKAILASHQGWKPNLATLAACLEYLKGKGSTQVAEELIKLLQENGSIPKEVCDRLVNYMESGDPTLNALDVMGGKIQAPERERGMEF